MPRPELKLYIGGGGEVPSISPIELINSRYPGLVDDEDFCSRWADEETQSVELYSVTGLPEASTFYTGWQGATENWLLTVQPDGNNLWSVVHADLAD